MKCHQVTVRVPATTANLGPGFDCLGMALGIWNEVRLQVSHSPEVRIEGQGVGQLPEDTSNVVYQASQRIFYEAGVSSTALAVRCENRIHLKRGLGSSAAAIVGGLVAANNLIEDPLPIERLLTIAAELEGHPDNVAAALLGGAQIVIPTERGLVTAPVRVPKELRAVLYIPEGTVSTIEARAALPRQVSLDDAVYNIGRSLLLINALSADRLQDLLLGTQDRIHQPYRQDLFPAMRVIMREAINAGALGAFVSGSGPTVLAFTQGKEMSIAYEMAEAGRKTNASGETIITEPTDLGVHVVETSMTENAL